MEKNTLRASKLLALYSCPAAAQGERDNALAALRTMALPALAPKQAVRTWQGAVGTVVKLVGDEYYVREGRCTYTYERWMLTAAE